MDRPKDRDIKSHSEIYKVKATLISTTNPKMNHFTGMNGMLTYGEGISGYFNMWNYYLYTSQITKVTEEDNDVVKLNTLNSIYIFRKDSYES